MKTNKYPYEKFIIKTIGRKAFDDLKNGVTPDDEFQDNDRKLAELLDELDLEPWDVDGESEEDLFRSLKLDEQPNEDILPFTAVSERAFEKPVASKPGSTPISIRISNAVLDECKRRAKKMGKPYQTLVKRLLTEGLAHV